MSMDAALTTNIIASTLMVLTYAYLYIQYKHSYLVKWLTAWIIHEVRIIFLEKAFIDQSSLYLGIMYGVLVFAHCLLLTAGTMELAGKKFSVIWLSGCILVLFFSVIGRLMGLPTEAYLLPGAIYIAFAYASTARAVSQINNGLGVWLTAGGFFLLGIHALDMPFLFQIRWFAPWGYLMDALLRSTVAIGIVLIYFEKLRVELAEKEKYYRLLADNATDVIYRYQLIRPVGFEYISPSVKKLTGYDPAEIKTLRNVMRIIHPADRGNFKKLIKPPIGLNDFTTLRVVHKNGDILWVEPKQNVIANSDGQPLAIEGIMRDITKRVLLEQDVARLDRLNIVGQMAANLAHEVRNPLTTVRGYLQLFGNKREFQHYKEQFTLLLDELDRTNHIITEYLALSKNKSIEMKKCNLNEIILTIHPLIKADAVSFNIETVLELGKIPNLYLDDKEIKQLILNFTRNAIEAMPSGGKLTITTTIDSKGTILSVADQGPGIPQQVLENLGKPFLTTKATGTGLGMAICYRIAHRHNAKLDINTGPAGTTINIRFETIN
ncbi:PAS domain-containing sensor histidine kinase [Sporomusa termitida]|uniref:histidine kinase n=1 Tax=Sporomusa termitida TaxID=2377 RepID=A0A517DQ33_9FIRM|nr:PAS domain-containing sensor histidine kinase [Sporomusa termitida]QDR79469.1 Adaptive-response sensory-kinase SasA [Sporomusa termitida]